MLRRIAVRKKPEGRSERRPSLALDPMHGWNQVQINQKLTIRSVLLGNREVVRRLGEHL